jgi:hypothetical protein
MSEDTKIIVGISLVIAVSLALMANKNKNEKN